MNMNGSSGAPQPVAAYTTEQIQRLLDENQQLIFAIIEKQKMKKYNECAQYQDRLQQNLVKLATIADQQPALSQVPNIKQPSPPPTNPIHPALLQQKNQQYLGQMPQQFRQ